MPECPTCGEEYDSDRAMKAHHQHHDKPYYDKVVESEFGMSPKEFLNKYHREEKLPMKELGEMIGGTTGAITQMAERHGVETLSQSEAKKAMWDRTDNPDKFLSAAHEKTKELVESGDHNFQDSDFERVLTEEFKEEMGERPDELAEWLENNPEKLSEFAKLGAPAREENGMAGKTGQDNPNWRGGKSIYDAVKKQLPGGSWRAIKDKAKKNDGHYCQNCGAIGVKLDTHHIVPIMAGGTNEGWNLITLCESCHTKAESYVREYSEFSPVLTE